MRTTCCACFASTTVLMSERFTCIISSPYHDPAGHLRMNGTEIGVRARRREGERELLVGIQYLRLEHLVRAHQGVRDVVAIRPRHGVARHHSQLGRSEAE